jgi:class 3 adenylate cyclase
MLLLGLSSTVQAQEANRLDSLHAVYRQSSDTARLLLLGDIAYEYIYSNPDTVNILLDEIEQKADAFAYTKPKARTYRIRGIIHIMKGNYEEGIRWVLQGVSVAEDTGFSLELSSNLNTLGMAYRIMGDYPKAIAYHQRVLQVKGNPEWRRTNSYALNSMGDSYFQQGNYADALDHYQQSMRLREEMGDVKWIMSSLLSIGKIYFSQQQYDKAIESHTKAMVLAEKHDNQLFRVYALILLGNCADALGNSTEGISNYTKAIDISKKYQYYGEEATALRHKGESQLKAGDAKTALVALDAAIVMLEQYKIRQGLAQGFIAKSKAELALGNAPAALAIAQKALAIAKEGKELSQIQDASLMLAKAYQQTGQSADALVHYQNYMAMRDSLNNIDKLRKIAGLEFKYQIENKDREVALWQAKSDLQAQEARNQRLFLGILVLGLLAVGVFAAVAVRNSIRRKRLNLKLSSLNDTLRIQRSELALKTDQLSQMNEEMQQANEELQSTLELVEREKLKSESLLLNILPEQTAQELKELGKAQPRFYESATVLFTDFVGFTSIAESLSPEELVKELDDIFRMFDHIMARHGLEKIKTIGDAYMAVGGVPKSNASHSLDAVYAAIDMQRSLKNRPDWKLRIGIHTGAVIAGVVGEHKFAYDIWGDAVNVAARMEQSGEGGQINISEITYNYIHEFSSELPFHFTFRGKIPVKNKGEIGMYFVQG